MLPENISQFGHFEKEHWKGPRYPCQHGMNYRWPEYGNMIHGTEQPALEGSRRANLRVRSHFRRHSERSTSGLPASSANSEVERMIFGEPTQWPTCICIHRIWQLCRTQIFLANAWKMPTWQELGCRQVILTSSHSGLLIERKKGSLRSHRDPPSDPSAATWASMNSLNLRFLICEMRLWVTTHRPLVQNKLNRYSTDLLSLTCTLLVRTTSPSK